MIKYSYLWIIVCLIGLCPSGILLSQESDSLNTFKKPGLFAKDTLFMDTFEIDSIGQKAKNDTLHSPQKALLYSAILPGLGQAYNQNWWKVPVVYAGFAVLGYFAYDNAVNYVDYLNGYIDYRNGVPEEISAYKDLKYYNPEYNDPGEVLRRAKDSYRRYRDIYYLSLVGWYFLNVIDANISAYFKQYDVSNDLSLKIKPAVIPNENFLASGFGISLQLNF